MKLNQKGAVDFIFVAVLVVLLAASAFTLWRIQAADQTVSDTAANTSNESSISSLNNEASDSTGGEDSIAANLFTSKSTGFKFDYPDSWTIKDSTDTICSTNINDECSEFVEIISSDGVIVRFVEHDEPFNDRVSCGIQAACNDYDVLSVDSVSSSSYPSLVVVTAQPSDAAGPIKLPEIHLHSPLSEDTKLNLGKNNQDNQDYDFGINFENFSVNVFVTVDPAGAEEVPDKFQDISSEEFLQTASVKEAIEILKSFR